METLRPLEQYVLLIIKNLTVGTIAYYVHLNYIDEYCDVHSSIVEFLLIFSMKNMEVMKLYLYLYKYKYFIMFHGLIIFLYMMVHNIIGSNGKIVIGLPPPKIPSKMFCYKQLFRYTGVSVMFLKVL